MAAPCAEATELLSPLPHLDALRAQAGPGFCDGGGCRSRSQRLLHEASPALRWPSTFPLGPFELQRQDEGLDATFYAAPRLVQHFGDAPRAALADFYADVAAEYARGEAVSLHVDLCSSWVSHLPEDYAPKSVIGLGMNEAELGRNPRLTSYVVKDLNGDPTLPFDEDSVDIFTNAMSVDYLVKPLEVHREMLRALRPGGLAVLSFSNRCFPTKVIAAWRESGDVEHCVIAMTYLRYAGFEAVEAFDVHTGDYYDPLFVIIGRKPNARDGGGARGGAGGGGVDGDLQRHSEL
eukprot:NODE_14545_length_1102_cov_4.897436.p1 GENE.NODE_14545_length_1102_cov_4.897436~~NODE_14545_length_1102_cov_4.897436.p1  ORF type:complete len:335 (-),score=107.07 NODE_14545_length_1102_cov_4.897436:97-972(-)